MHEKRTTLPASIIASIRARKNRGSGHAPHDPASGLLVASYNVHKCVGVDGRFDPGRIAQVIREIGADIIALQEADTRFGERRGLLDLSWMERETGLCPVPVSGVARAHGWHDLSSAWINDNTKTAYAIPFLSTTTKLPGCRRAGQKS